MNSKRKMYITEIDAEIEGDTYFPKFSRELFERKIDERIAGPIPYAYVTYTRL